MTRTPPSVEPPTTKTCPTDVAGHPTDTILDSASRQTGSTLWASRGTLARDWPTA